MKKWLILIIALGLTGCGGDDKSPTATSSPNSHQFQIGNDVFSAYLPPNWRIMAPPKGSETVFVAYHRHQNFIILQNTTSTPTTLVENLKNSAQEDFFVFQNFTPHKKNPLRWTFSGKTSPTEPLRQYHQKAIFLEDQKHYLMGSCAFEIDHSSGNVCEDILTRWEKEERKE